MGIPLSHVFCGLHRLKRGFWWQGHLTLVLCLLHLSVPVSLLFSTLVCSSLYFSVCLPVFYFSLSLPQGPFLPLPLFLCPPVCLCLPSSLPLWSLFHAPLSVWLLCAGPGPLGLPTRELRGVRGTKGPSFKLLSHLLGQALPLRNARYIGDALDMTALSLIIGLAVGLSPANQVPHWGGGWGL